MNAILSYNLIESNTAYEVSCQNKSGVTVANIPAEYNNLPVIQVAASGFSGCPNLEEVTLSSNIVNIDANAFVDCPLLSRIHYRGTIEQWVRIVGLDSLMIRDTLRLPLNNKKLFLDDQYGESEEVLEVHVSENGAIAPYAFFGCYRIHKITLSDSIRNIGNWAFAITGISSISLPAQLHTLGPGVFEGSNLKEINIPSSVVAIPQWIFAHCPVLERVCIDSGVQYIDEYAFAESPSLKEFILLPETPPTVVNANAFKDLDASAVFYCSNTAIAAYREAAIWSTFASSYKINNLFIDFIHAYNQSKNNLVPKTFRIAGVDCQDDITRQELKSALDVAQQIDLTSTTLSFQPHLNTKYVFGTLNSLTLLFPTNAEEGDKIIIEFAAGNTPPTVSFMNEDSILISESDVLRTQGFVQLKAEYKVSIAKWLLSIEYTGLIVNKPSLGGNSRGGWMFGSNTGTGINNGILSLRGAYLLSGASIDKSAPFMVSTTFTRSASSEFGFLVTTDNDWNGTQKNLMMVVQRSSGKFYIWGENPGLWWSIASSVTIPAEGQEMTLTLVYKNGNYYMFVNDALAMTANENTQGEGWNRTIASVLTGDTVYLGLVSMNQLTTFTSWKYSWNETEINKYVR